MRANEILIPILMVFIIFLGWKCKQELGQITYLPIMQESHWIIRSILYSSYNSIILIPILISLKNYMQDSKQILCVSIICFAILSILSIGICALLLKISTPIESIEIPAVYASSLLGGQYAYLYGFIILAAILTSAISAGYSFLENCTKNTKSYLKASIILVLSSFLVAKFGFSNLVNRLYPVFGYLGLGQILLLFRKNKS